MEIPLLGDERTGAGRLCQARPNRFTMRFSQPDGDRIVVGARADQPPEIGGVDSGSAYVFRYDGTNWQDVYATDGTELVVDASNNYASTIRLQSALNIRAVLAGATAPDVTVALV